MGDGELSPINTRKSYILEKQRGKLRQTQKITEADPQVYVDKIKKDKEYEIYYDPYKDKKVQPILVSLFSSFFRLKKE